jgi:SAM-dependent methyltransferase
MRLNIGCGSTPLKGFVNVDVNSGDVSHDLTLMPWPFESEKFEHVHASHVLEHFDKHVGYCVLDEIHRLLVPGGRLTIAVPDLDKFITAHVTGNFEPLGGYGWPRLDTLMGGGDAEPDPYNRHRQMYCFETLAYMLHTTHFGRVVRREFDSEIDNPNHAAFSLYLETRK